ncbi:MAG: UDP-N-acetylmuramoyl-tripeptide--D-alanyl-D-alanine ligase [Methylophilaceae bacterium]
MMMLSEIASALNTCLIGEDVSVLSVGTDSRHITKDQLFVAIKGENFDGNSYAVEAVRLGASASLISDVDVKASPSILVKDTRLALGNLAHYWRQKFDLPLVAVTGSNGKTTVKEMIASILIAAKGKVLATEDNLNNDIGMPLSLLKIRAEHTCAVIEMGMNHEGEIRYLTNIAKPQVAVVNNAGTAHLGELGSREAIARAKGEVFEGLAADGVAVINVNDDFAEYWQSLTQDKKTLTFGLDVDADVSAQYLTNNSRSIIDLKTPEGRIELSLGVLGKHNVSNALAAATVAVTLGISNADIALGLNKFSGVSGRLNSLAGYQDAIVIDDTYNANENSMKAAVDVLASQKNSEHSRLIFVMGDMAELGDETKTMHAGIGDYAKKKGITYFFSFGEMSQLASKAFGSNAQHFESIDSLVEVVKGHMSLATCVLVKGSRFMKMERVVKDIIKDKNFGSAH